MVICGRSRLSAAGGYWSKTGNFKHLQSSSKTFYTLYKLIYIYTYAHASYYITHTRTHTHIYTYVYACILTVRPVKPVLTPPSERCGLQFPDSGGLVQKGGPGPRDPRGPRGPRRPRKRVFLRYTSWMFNTDIKVMAYGCIHYLHGIGSLREFQI